MRKLGFKERWINLVMGCVKIVSYSVLVNGEPCGMIFPTRGIRQGDPLSPFLFLLCTEGLNGLIKKAELQGDIHGYSLCWRGPKLMHLLFVDDSLIFSAMDIPEELNRTHITLIPKIPGPETLNNYRPISLCNTVYKIVSKILVAWLRPLLGKLISPCQSAFIPGRKGMDNAIIVQELINTISRKKGRHGFMAVKIDLEKAYDKLEWGFIREMLIRINLPQNIIKLIMSCVSTVSTSIVVNGGALD